MQRSILIFILALAALIGCSKDDNKNPAGSGGGTTADSVTLDATTYDHYAYFNVESKQTVDLTDAQAKTSGDWHIAFSRINAKLNGGASGPLGVKAVDLATIGDPDSTTFDAVDSVPEIADDQWQEDAVTLVFSPWYSYDPVQHVLSPNHYLFVVKTADGKYAKVLVDSLINPGFPPNMGTIVLKYVYQSDGSGDLSGATQYARLDGTSGSVCFSFASGGEVSVADPATSTAWDIWFDNYDAKINGGVSGPGQAALLPYENATFESVSAAPAGAPFFTDALSSIFGSPTVSGSEWYHYNDVTHEISSKHHVYILRLADDHYYKLMIANYYKVVSGSPVPAWITLKYKQIPERD